MLNGIELGSGWWVLLLGWPAIIAALIAFSLAVARKSRKLGALACLLAAPMFLYLAATPRFSWLALGSFAFLCILTWRVKKSGWLANAILALPAVSILVWLAYAVATQ